MPSSEFNPGLNGIMYDLSVLDQETTSKSSETVIRDISERYTYSYSHS